MNQELDQAREEARAKVKHENSKGAIGVGVAGTAFFVILLLLLFNLTSILNRRSPFMEYTACHNERLSAIIVPYTRGSVPSPEAIEDYADANDLASGNPCPGLEVIKDPKAAEPNK
jgi:hypothetical protein